MKRLLLTALSLCLSTCQANCALASSAEAALGGEASTQCQPGQEAGGGCRRGRSARCSNAGDSCGNESDPNRIRAIGAHRFHRDTLTLAESKSSEESAAAKGSDKKPERGSNDSHKAGESSKSGESGKQTDERQWNELLESSKKLYEAGKENEASSELDLALGAAERLKTDGGRADAYQKLGEHYLYLHQYERAKSLMEEGLKLKRKIPGFKSVANANSLDNLAQAYARTGDLETASKFEQEALSTYQSLKKTETHDYAIALSNHANTLRQLKQYKEAEQFFAKAVATQQKLEKEDSIELAKILLNAGGMYCETDKLDSAKRLLDRASKIIRTKLNKEHPLYRLSVKSERVLYKKRVDFLLKKDSNPVRPEVAQAVLHLAALYDAEGDTAQSVAAYKQGLSIEEKLLPENSAELKKVRDDYATVSKKLSN